MSTTATNHMRQMMSPSMAQPHSTQGNSVGRVVPIHSTPANSAAQASPNPTPIRGSWAGQGNRPDTLILVNERLYEIAPDAVDRHGKPIPAWKRWFNNHVLINVWRFHYLKLDLPLPDGFDPDGRVWFLSQHRICFTEWEAYQTAETLKHPMIHVLPTYQTDPHVVECASLMPKSPLAARYEQNGGGPIEQQLRAAAVAQFREALDAAEKSLAAKA